MGDGVLRERLAVLGSPIAHSRSPRIHSAVYEALGLDWAYGRQELQADELAGFLAGPGSQLRGLSLTMPLKEEAHRLAAVLDPVAAESGVANTLLRLVDGAGWAGFNTDVGGLAAAIREAGIDAARTIVIGSGATAISAILAARRIGARRVTVLARNRDAMEALVARFSGTSDPDAEHALEVTGVAFSSLPESLAAERSREATLVVSTLPGSAGSALALPDAITGVPLFDVAYDPWPSPLAERWRAAGGEAHSGLGMLIHQALLQVRVFVGGDTATPLDEEERVLAAMRAAATVE